MGPSMDLAGFEPATSSVRLKRAPNCATGPPCGLHCTCIAMPCQVTARVLYWRQSNSTLVEVPVARMPGHNGEAGRVPVRRCPATVKPVRDDLEANPIIVNDHWLSQETRLGQFSDNLRGKGVECEVERNVSWPPPSAAGEVFCISTLGLSLLASVVCERSNPRLVQGDCFASLAMTDVCDHLMGDTLRMPLQPRKG